MGRSKKQEAKDGPVFSGRYERVYIEYLIERLKRASYSLTAMEVVASKKDRECLNHVFGGNAGCRNICHEAVSVLITIYEEEKKKVNP